MAGSVSPLWQRVYLKTAGLPQWSENVQFLTEWGRNANSGCDYNALDLSKVEKGSRRCSLLPNGRHARSYPDTQTAANAFADQLNLTDYPHLREALAGGHPYAASVVAGVGLDLEKWGSTRWQAAYLKQTTGSGQGAGDTGSGRVPSSQNVSGAWTRLQRTFAVEGNKTIVELRKSAANLRRIERRLRRA